MLHADKTWSGPEGWLKTIEWSLSRRSTPNGRCRSSSLLWFILALPSILVFVTWPLSGLSLEVTEEYHFSRGIGPANMTGSSYNTFNERGSDEAYLDAALKWSSAQVPTIPSAGVAYTQEGFDRSKFAFLDQLPVTFSKDDGIPTIFLTAQAHKPAKGNVCGLQLQYNCSIIHKAQDFQIINKTHSSEAIWDNDNSNTHDDSKLFKDKRSVLGWQNDAIGHWVQELQAHFEAGFRIWTYADSSYHRMRMTLEPAITDCYLRRFQNDTYDYPGS